MPKQKTHSATKKRVTKTASGKLKVSRANRNHLKGNKSKSAIRRNRKSGYVDPSDHARIKNQVSQIK